MGSAAAAIIAAIIAAAATTATGIASGVQNKRARDEARSLYEQGRQDDLQALTTSNFKTVQEQKMARESLGFDKQKFATENYNSNQDRSYSRLKDHLSYIANILNNDVTLKNNLVTKLSQQGVSSGLQL